MLEKFKCHLDVFYTIYNYRPQRSCRKVMFLHLCVILFMGGHCQGDPPGQRLPRTETSLDRDPPGQRPPDRDPPDRDPLDTVPLDRDLPGQRSPGQRPPGQRPPWTETPWAETPHTVTSGWYAS